MRRIKCVEYDEKDRPVKEYNIYIKNNKAVKVVESDVYDIIIPLEIKEKEPIITSIRDEEDLKKFLE